LCDSWSKKKFKFDSIINLRIGSAIQIFAIDFLDSAREIDNIINYVFNSNCYEEIKKNKKI